MKLERFRQEESGVGLPLSAMIDVLFLMVIFLVLAANFDTIDTVRLPEGRGKPTQAAEGMLRLELRQDGSLVLEGEVLAAERVIPRLKEKNPASVLILRDERGAIAPLFRWVHRLREALDVPVQVGVRPPPEGRP